VEGTLAVHRPFTGGPNDGPTVPRRCRRGYGRSVPSPDHADRLVSLAAGVILDVDPVGAVEVAAASGFPAVGIWFDPATWTSATAQAVARRLADTGTIALDIEPVILGRGSDAGERVVEAAATIGARHLLVASGGAEPAKVIDRVRALCELAEAIAPGLRIVVEFLPIFSIPSLPAALEVVAAVAHPAAAVLVDSLHLSRSGGSPADLRGVRPDWLPYLQIADAPADPPGTDFESRRDEALHGRLLPGSGDLPLRDLLDTVPHVALSFEVRSAALMADHPDPIERARVLRASVSSLVGDRR
jgi:sugar phosphate isomerase/epimerase